MALDQNWLNQSHLHGQYNNLSKFQPSKANGLGGVRPSRSKLSIFYLAVYINMFSEALWRLRFQNKVCTVYGCYRFSFRLIFSEPVTTIHGGLEKHIIYGSKINLTCEVLNYPEKLKYIVWYKNSKVYLVSSYRVCVYTSDSCQYTSSIYFSEFDEKGAIQYHVS